MVKRIESKTVPIDSLIPAPYNPRRATKKDIDDLKKNIQEVGFVDPILVNTYPGHEGVIISGHLRIKALKELGETEVEVKFIEADPILEQKLNIRFNSIGGEFDNEALSELIYKLSEEGEPLNDIGFDEKEIQKLLDKVAGEMVAGENIDIELCPTCGQKIHKKD